jgi:hypothetical protein
LARSREPGISVAIVEPVARALAALGYRGPDLAAPAGVRFVAGSNADATLDAAAAELSAPALGLSLARRIPIGRLGDLDYALCTSSTLREGLWRLARFYGVVTQRVKLSLVEAPPRAWLVLARRPDVPHSRHWLEFSFAIIAERIRQTVGREVVFDEVTLAHPPPPSGRGHYVVFRTHVR